jgi:hypothetical protein
MQDCVESLVCPCYRLHVNESVEFQKVGRKVRPHISGDQFSIKQHYSCVNTWFFAGYAAKYRTGSGSDRMLPLELSL